MITPEQILQSARDVLLGKGSVTDGWHGVDVALDGGQLLVVFTWRQLPYQFAVRIGLDDFQDGVWTGAPVSSARDWVYELSGMLMEELETGAAAWLPRVERDGLVELLIDEPRVGQLPPAMTAEHAVGTRGIEGGWFVRDNGLDLRPAADAAARGRLRQWWNAYVNNAQGLPLVGQLVVTGGGGSDAHLEYLQVRDNLPDPVPQAVISEMIYLAVWAAACDGARLVTSTIDHPAMAAAGLQRDGDRWIWHADGPALAPPDLVLPFRYDAERAAAIAQYADPHEEIDDDPDEAAGWEAVGSGQAELAGDVDRLLDYGQQYPHAWGGLRFNGTRLVVSFTDPEEHRGVVADLVQHPDRVDVVKAQRSELERQRIKQAVVRVLDAHPGTWMSAGLADQHVNVDLFASGLPVAEKLWAEHGDALKITVAGHAYPLDGQHAAAQPLQLGTQQTATWPDGLRVDLDLDETTPRSGRHIGGDLVLHATTRGVRFDSDQPLYGELLDQDGHRVNDLSGFRMGTGFAWDLAPGRSGRVRFSVSTNSARLRDGPRVPPGTWSLIVAIPVHTFDDETPTRTKQLIAGPFKINLGP